MSSQADDGRRSGQGRIESKRLEAASPNLDAHFNRVWPHWPRLIRLAISRGARAYDAEDLASESIVQVVRQGNLNDALDPWPYLARTLTNLMKERLRREAAENRALVKAVEVPTHRTPEDDALDEHVAARVLQRLCSMETLDTVRLVVDYVGGDHTWEQLGSRHGLSPSAARKRVERAVRRLHGRIAAAVRQ